MSSPLSPLPRTNAPRVGDAPPRPIPPPATGLATASIVAACAHLLTTLASFGILWHIASAVSRGNLTTTAANDLVALGQTSLGVSVIVLVVVYVVSCAWLARSRTLATKIAPGYSHTRGPGAVWYGWIVPVILLWFPYQVVRDIYGASASGRTVSIGRWWGLWISGSVLGNIAGQLSSTGASSPMILLLLAGAAMTVGAFVLWVRIILQIRAGQAAAYRAAQEPAS